jgi:hypothetical protein
MSVQQRYSANRPIAHGDVVWVRLLKVAIAIAAALAVLGVVKTAAGNIEDAAAPPDVPGKAVPFPDDGVQAMLPVAPQQQSAPAPLLGDLAAVPEIFFQDPAVIKLSPEQWQQKMVKQLAKIEKLNNQETDGFLKALLANRPDLAGLPVLMGDACRMPQEQLQAFGLGLNVLRLSMKKLSFTDHPVPSQDAKLFWQGYQQVQDKLKTAASKKAEITAFSRGQVAGLMQVLAPESAFMREGLVNILVEIPHPVATRALAQLAVFAPEPSVRQAAVKALKERDKQDATDTLLAGLRYPWPAVAGHAAKALVELGRTDLVPNLVDMLGEPDPRLPVTKKVGGKEVIEVKQLVKLNHNQNCLLCHPPAGSDTPKMVVSAPMPAPNKPIPSFSQGYGKSKFKSEGEILVRVDMTYLRQDFSVLLQVPNAHPWPEKQRFDFLVRTVTLTPAQAKLFQDQLQPKAGAYTPYQQALLLALRGLTGANAEPTPQAWKKVLHLPG